MNTKINYNTLLCEPTLFYDFNKPSGSESKHHNTRGIEALLLSKNDRHVKVLKLDDADLAYPLEFYIRSMLCACASTISIPAYGGSMWATPNRIKAILSESTGKRLKFVDRNHTIWNAAEKYLQPVYDDLKEKFPKGNPRVFTPDSIGILIWDLYLLLLAVRGHSEVPILPSSTIAAINDLEKRSAFSIESKARLSIIRGIFSLFKEDMDIPGFRCLSNRNQSLRDRLDEILDDAYLLDASRLRRFFGVQSNTRSIKKDLRKVINFIVKHRPWAKGTIAAASQTAMLAGSASELMDKVFDIFPEMSQQNSIPVLINSDHLSANMGDLLVASSQRVPFQQRETWMVSVRKNRIL